MNHLELELQAVVSAMCVLGTEPRAVSPTASYTSDLTEFISVSGSASPGERMITFKAKCP